MKRILVILFCLTMVFIGYTQEEFDNCSSFIVTKGASVDGSVMITYTCDGEFLSKLQYLPAQKHEPGTFIEVRDRSGKLKGKIKQPPQTYAVVGLMNEFQVAIGETTFGGRPELVNRNGLLHYFQMMRLTLQRVKTARGAVIKMGELVSEYGYGSSGESFSIADKKEAWIMEMVGTGKNGPKGAHWVALRVPDGYICAHSNMSRIGTFPLNDSKKCLYSKGIVEYARKMGIYSKKSDKKFNFRYAFDPPKPSALRTCAARVWSMFRRSAPSLKLSADFQRGVKGTKPYPLWIKPDKKISLKDVMNTMRDHYEGTPYDMTKGVDAGPFGCPVRFRGLTWKVDGEEYSWERPISTQQTAFSFVSQSRDFLPDPIGGVYWYGLDDTYTSCYVPLYCSITDVPESFTKGDIQKFTWDSAWWVFNFVANFANVRYSDMVVDIQKVQNELEGDLITMQPHIEKTAQAMFKNNPQLVNRFLTQYSVSNGDMVVKRWIQLAEHLITKYNDGYVKDENGRPRSKGYSQSWLKKVIKSNPNQFKLPKWGDKKRNGRLD